MLYFYISCSNDPAGLLAAMRDAGARADGSSQIGFRAVGDESFATRSDDPSIEAVFRKGSTVVSLNAYSEEISLSVIEELADAIAAGL